MEKVICIKSLDETIGKVKCNFTLGRIYLLHPMNNNISYNRKAIQDDNSNYYIYVHYAHFFMSLYEFRQSKLDILCI